MDVFSILSLIGGLAMFLYGMSVMGQGLERAAGGRLEHTLEKLTDSRLKGVLLGVGVTALIQSSSATTVMVVGFVNSGIMKLTQATGVIMGANIGTTVTAWILSLTSIESTNVIVNLLKPVSFAPILAAIGAVLVIFVKSRKRRNIGSILMGFALLMFGMAMMSEAVEPLAADEGFRNFMVAFENPLLGLLVGLVLTAIIQSSSASVGILQALTVTKGITYAMAIPIILGQNIGTCVTALISCAGANKNAKRAAMVHLYFNVFGAALIMAVYYGADAIFKFSFYDSVMNSTDVAIVHTVMKVIMVAVLLPLSGMLEKLACKTIKSDKSERDMPILDERFLSAPGFAVEQCKRAAERMALLARDTLTAAVTQLEHYDKKAVEGIEANESMLDKYEDLLGTYLVKLSGNELSDRDSREVSMMLHTIGDFERIGDHAVNILEVASELDDKKASFSESARAELSVIRDAVSEILSLATDSFVRNDVAAAKKVEPLEQVIDNLKDELKSRHIERLQKGGCTIEMGFILSDLLTNYERVSDHCSNVAVAVIEISLSSFDTHGYLNEIKNSNQPEFVGEFRGFDSKYRLPAKEKL